MKLLFADCETTGVTPGDKIVELAWVITDQDLNTLDARESLINPGMPIPPAASSVHHITNKMVEGAPGIEAFMESLGYPLHSDEPMLFIAHNAPFDLRYFGPWLHPDTPALCTYRLARKLFPEADSHKLQALRYHLDLPEVEGAAHSAMADVRVLMHLVTYCMSVADMGILDLLALSQEPLDIKTMPFGKHKGKPLREVPRDYLRWLLAQDNLDPDLRASIEKYGKAL